MDWQHGERCRGGTHCRWSEGRFREFSTLSDKVTRPVSDPILDPNANLIRDKSQKMEFWRNYYTGLFNRPNAPDFQELIATAQSAIEDPTINCSELSVKETTNCLNII